jgi:hypothetical protein
MRFLEPTVNWDGKTYSLDDRLSSKYSYGHWGWPSEEVLRWVSETQWNEHHLPGAPVYWDAMGFKLISRPVALKMVKVTTEWRRPMAKETIDL